MDSTVDEKLEKLNELANEYVKQEEQYIRSVDNKVWNAYVQGYKKAEEKYKYKTPDILPDSWGTYLVVLDKTHCSRYCAFRTYSLHSPADSAIKEMFNEPEDSWLLEPDEKLVYWMKIPDWC